MFKIATNAMFYNVHKTFDIVFQIISPAFVKNVQFAVANTNIQWLKDFQVIIIKILQNKLKNYETKM